MFLSSLSISNVQLFVAFNKWLWAEIEVKVQLDQFITFMSIKIQRKIISQYIFFSSVTKKGLRIIVNKLDCWPALLVDTYRKLKWLLTENYISPLLPINTPTHSKIQQTKMLVTCQRFGDLFLFGLVWQYSSVQTKYNKGRFKVMATYLQQ